MASSSSGRREEASVQEGRRVTIQPSQEPVLLAGVNAEDERFSWRAALAVMLILSAVASLAFILNVNPFAISFNISFVYLPTVVLVIGHFVTRARSKADNSAS
jgi:hypothetical protein